MTAPSTTAPRGARGRTSRNATGRRRSQQDRHGTIHTASQNLLLSEPSAKGIKAEPAGPSTPRPVFLSDV